MKKVSKKYGLALLLHFSFLFLLGITFLLICSYAEWLKSISNADSDFWLYDFPSALLGIGISIIAAHVYTKEWIPLVKKKTGVELSLD